MGRVNPDNTEHALINGICVLICNIGGVFRYLEGEAKVKEV